ncbi:MAG TPA: biopolymer transporter ExbD [Polyangiaceae bacterium]|nr:biopolymer transporter ExbD [Polyangiaceae bacterium]
MAFSAGGAKGVKNDINVTPLVDVVLVLLIIFMVITPMLQRGKDVKLPEAKNIEQENKDSESIMVSVTTDKRIWLESNPVEPDALESSLKETFAQTPGRKVLVKGDQSLTVAEVRKVMDRVRKAGGKGVSLAVEEFKKK